MGVQSSGPVRTSLSSGFFLGLLVRQPWNISISRSVFKVIIIWRHIYLLSNHPHLHLRIGTGSLRLLIRLDHLEVTSMLFTLLFFLWRLLRFCFLPGFLCFLRTLNFTLPLCKWIHLLYTLQHNISERSSIHPVLISVQTVIREQAHVVRFLLSFSRHPHKLRQSQLCKRINTRVLFSSLSVKDLT